MFFNEAAKKKTFCTIQNGMIVYLVQINIIYYPIYCLNNHLNKTFDLLTIVFLNFFKVISQY